MKRALWIVGLAALGGCADSKADRDQPSKTSPDKHDAGHFSGDAGHFSGDAGGLTQELADEIWACQNRSLDGCAGEDKLCVVVTAQRYDADEKCFGEFEPAACTARITFIGGGVEYCREAPDGSTWRFRGGELPVLEWIETPLKGVCDIRRPCG